MNTGPQSGAFAPVPTGWLARVRADYDRKEWWSLAAVAWSAMLLGGALVLEHGFGLEPCALCLNQRFWVVLGGVCAVAGFAHNPGNRLYPALTTAAALGGAYFAGKHIRLLTLPADEVPRCGVEFSYMLDAFPVADVLRAMVVGTGECTDQAATVPILALAGFVGMIALSVMQWRSRG